MSNLVLVALALLTAACSVDPATPVGAAGTSGASGATAQGAGGSGGQAGDSPAMSGSSGQANAGSAGAPGGTGGGSGTSSGPAYAASCFDGHKGKGETDVDCGGDCPRCHQEQACAQASDCWNGDCTAGGTCSAVCPPGMAAYTPEAPAKPFCVDLTEVTQAAYAAFLATAPSTGRQRPLCQVYNPSFAPHDSSPANAAQCSPGSYRPDETPERPVACVDWCDADAYCRERGLHLCGSITSPGTGLEFGHDQTLTTDQWYFACTEGDDDHTYVYGDAYEPDACTGRDAFASAPHAVDVGSVTTCRAGPGRPLDLNGNVAELVNELLDYGTSGSVPVAKTSGGSFNADEKDLECASLRGIPIDEGSPQVGFRCCGS